MRATSASGQMVQDGTYTVVFDGDEDDYLTVRVKPHWEEDRAARGERVLQYLAGPDNETSFAFAAFITRDGDLRVKRAFQGGAFEARVREAWSVLVAGDDETLAEARESYAKRSGRCALCGRTLTVPASLHRGLGPTCAGRV
jgi:hypothetical protein